MIEEGCISTSAVYDDGIASIELIKLSGSLSKNNMIGVIDCIYLSKLRRTVSPFPPQLKKRGSIHPYRTRKEMRLDRNMGEGCKQIRGNKASEAMKETIKTVMKVAKQRLIIVI